jgi:osmotically-inducible protein OsmY
MAFRDFFRGERERDEDERNRERWRAMQAWRDQDRDQERDYERRFERDQYRGRQVGYEGGYGQGYRQGGQDYGVERSGSFGAGSYSGQSNYGSEFGGEDYGRYRQGSGGEQSGRRYGYGYGGPGSEREERDYDYGRRGGSGAYSGSGYGGGFSRSGSLGEGSSGRESGFSRGTQGFEYAVQSGRGLGGGMESWGQGSQRQWGEHRGKGPRGYRRSDERIREEVCDLLTDDPQIDASDVEVTVKECEVTLTGQVNSREDKRRVEDLIERISGVKEITNNLRVAQLQSQFGAAGAEKGTTQSAQSAKH